METPLIPNNQSDHEKDRVESLDFGRLWHVFKKNRLGMLGFVILTVALAYVYVLYTQPVFSSNTIIKLNFDSEATMLGLAGTANIQEQNEISGEIEIIQSKLFLSRVVDVAKLDVSYHVYGRYVIDNHYKKSPFIISYRVHNPDFYDVPFNVVLEEEGLFTFSYIKDQEEVKKTYSFNEEIKTADFNLLLHKTEYYNPNDENIYFFVIQSRNELIGNLQKNLEVIPKNFKAKTIEISFTDFNRYKARDMVEIINLLYLDYTREVKSLAIEQKIKFLNGQILNTEKKLSQYENYFEEFTIENRTTNTGEDLSRTINQLVVLDSQRYHIRKNIIDLDLIQGQVNKKKSIIANPLLLERLPKSLGELVNEYSELRQLRELKLNSYNQSSYIIEQLDHKLDNAKTLLGDLLQSYKGTLADRVTEIGNTRKALEKNLFQMPSLGTEYGKNRRVYDLQEAFMISLQTTKMELEITHAGTITKNVILSPASLPEEPIKPRTALILITGFVLGMVFSIAFLLIRYLAHNKISSVRELEKLVSVPVLGAVPQYKKGKLSHTSLVVKKGSNSALSEALRTIRTNMDFVSSNSTVSITSTVSGEGKTFIAANLGAIIALTGQSVCIVDLDMRRPKVHLAFGGVNHSEGVSTILAKKSTVQESLQESGISGLSFISAGHIPPNPSELLLQDRFKEMLKELNNKFDVVILDTPPVGLVTDGRLIMKHCDIQLYIVRADYSKRSFIKLLNDFKTSGQFSNLTAILNSVDSVSEYGYGYYSEE